MPAGIAEYETTGTRMIDLATCIPQPGVLWGIELREEVTQGGIVLPDTGDAQALRIGVCVTAGAGEVNERGDEKRRFVKDGEFFMLLGPSGCGKTTTLRMMAGLELPTAGEIFIDGEEVAQKPASQRDIAFVFQMFALYPHMNVRKNISYPLVSQGVSRAEVDRRVAEVARILQIETILDKPVGGLSATGRPRHPSHGGVRSRGSRPGQG